MANNLLLSSLLLSIAFILGVYSDDIRHFDGYTVLRLTPKTESQLKFLHDIEQTTFEVDFWKPPAALNRTVDMMIPPHLKEIFGKVLIERDIVHETLIEDLEKNLAKERASQKSSSTRMDWASYKRFADIDAYLGEVAAANPGIAQVEIVGKSYQNRNIRVIKIGEGVANNNKPIIFIDAGIHAREWIGPAFATFLIDRLIAGYNNNATIKALLQKFDWYIVPVLNPDGYEYTHTNDRMWRKTRSPNAGSTCVGTDPNRNFGFAYGGAGTSTSPCSEIYRGTGAFSESETKALSDYILERKSRVKLYTAVHSYGQYWLYPWGCNSSLTADNSVLNSLGQVALTELTKSYGTRYTIGTSTNVLYAAAGGADDWTYGGAGVTYSYTVELRDTGSNGFTLPASQIIPCSTETTAGYIAMAQELAKRV